jgi:hypothetical protein
MVDYWVEISAREAENDGQKLPENRISALTQLSEIWLSFTAYIDAKEAMSTTILFVMKRAVRDRSRVLRIASIVQLFRILDTFGRSKNSSAPAIYKTLIFSLVESPSDPVVRELMYANFKDLFRTNRAIPIALLIDPLFKLIPTTLGSTFILKTFDFDFFHFISRHQKLQQGQAV